MVQYKKALPIYDLIKSEITLLNPNLMVDYAITLNETGNTEESIENFVLFLSIQF